MTNLTDPAPGSHRRWAIVVLGSANFLISMFYRVSVAVISPALMRDMNLSASELSTLSAAFYYAFAASQLPLGFALDRFGPRRCLGFLAVAAVGGALLFSFAKTPEHLIAARVLLGIGMSGNMMILLALLAAWFPVDRFASLSGLAICVGVLGNLLGTSPLALLSLSIGWRDSFLVFAGLNAVIVLAFIAVAQARPSGRSPARTDSGSAIGGLRNLFSLYSYWAISVSCFVRYGYFAALQSLWLGPFLIFGMGLGEVAAGNAILCMGIGYMVGLPLWGWLSDRMLRTRKWVVLPTMIVLGLLALTMGEMNRSSSNWLLLGTLFVLGFTASPGQIMYAHIKELVPPAMIARALTSVNLFTILGVGVMIHVLGLVVGEEPSALSGTEGFGNLWWMGMVGLAIVSLLYSFVPDSPALRPQAKGSAQDAMSKPLGHSTS